MIERQYLIDDFTNQDTWRLFRILAEFVEGFEEMSRVTSAISIFGSARTPEDHRHYRAARELARPAERELARPEAQETPVAQVAGAGFRPVLAARVAIEQPQFARGGPQQGGQDLE